MLFNSLEFPLFFLLVWAGFFLLPGARWRQYGLLSASLFFYGYWKWEYLVLLLATSALDFVVAIQVETCTKSSARKAWLSVSLVSNLLILGYFKYALFFARDLLGFPDSEIPEFLKVLLPVGISFYTFQAMGYVLDVYRKRLPATRDFVHFLLFITYFPQLVAGPIERAPHLMEQLRLRQLPDLAENRLLSACSLLVLGFGKKLILADRLSTLVDPVFNHPNQHSLPIWMLAVFLFGFQIYCDFSGYSDIARGISRLFGVELMHNFRQPYLASGFKDFWSRWHISLSGWFRDYLYIPLGGSHTGKIRSLFNLFLVFCLSGLWHGANLTFLIWGAWHGTGLVLERLLIPKHFQSRLWSAFSLLWIWLGWFWFRLNSLDDLSAIGKGISQTPFRLAEFKLSGSVSELTLALAGIAMLWLLDSKWKSLLYNWNRLGPDFRWTTLILSCFLILWFGTFKGQAFIYFQF